MIRCADGEYVMQPTLDRKGRKRKEKREHEEKSW